VPEHTYSSYESQQAANNQAIANINANGQDYANTGNNGICVLPGSLNIRVKPGASGPGGRFSIVVKNAVTQEEVFNEDYFDTIELAQNLNLPEGSYTVQISSNDMNGLKVTVNADEKAIGSGQSTTWTTSHTIVVEMASEQ